MAKQGFMGKVKGTIGDITFYRGKTNKGKGADLVKTKGGVERSKIMNDPAFARTRENMSEFAAAGLSAKGLYNTLATLLANAKDSQVSGRLCAAFKASITKDATNERGERVVQVQMLDEDLLGFQFNNKRNFSTTLFAKLETVVDRTAGTVTTTVGAHTPNMDVRYPRGATHYQICVATARLVNADMYEYDRVIAVGDFVGVMGGTEIVAADLVADIGAANIDPALIVVAAIKFYQELNGVKYPFADKTFNAAAIIAVDGE